MENITNDNRQQLTFVNSFFLFLKGILIGACMIVPGMSAGTVIIIMGIYGLLIWNINGLLFKGTKRFMNAVWFLSPIVLGCIVGVLTLSRFIELVITHYSLPTFALFAGFVLGSIPMIFNNTYITNKSLESQNTDCKSRYNKVRWWHILPVIMACAIVILFAIFQTHESSAQVELTTTTAIMLVVAGAITAGAMIIPGISGSFLLILIGYYATFLNALNTFDVAMLGLFVLGAPIGLIIAAKTIGFALKRFHTLTYLIIIGFLLGSVAAIFIYPETYNTGTNTLGIIVAGILFVLGMMSVLLLSKRQKT